MCVEVNKETRGEQGSVKEEKEEKKARRKESELVMYRSEAM